MFPLALLNPSAPAVDPASLTLALLHFDGADGSTTFTDSSPYNNTFTGTSVLSTTNPKFGSASLRSEVHTGTGAICARSDGFFELDDSDFTAETWFLAEESTWAKNLFMATDDGTTILPYDAFIVDGKIKARVQMEAGSVIHILEHQTTLTLNVYHHFAMVRSGNTLKCYLDGIESSISINIGSGILKTGITRLVVGRGAYGIQGFVDEFRLRKEAMYLTDFTPPTAPFTY